MNKLYQMLYILKNYSFKDFSDIYLTRKHQEYQYLDLLNKILKQGTPHSDRTGTGTIRLWGERLEFDLSNGKIPLYTTKKVSSRLIIEELMWFLKGATDVKKLQEKNVKIWNGNGSKEECEKLGRAEGDLGPIYGHQWRNFGATKKDEPLKEDYWSDQNKRWVNRAYNDDGKDQIKYIIDTINNNPDSRRILFSGWNPQEADKVNPPPCHTFYLFQVEGDKLNSMLVNRSSDKLLGSPYNIASLAILTHLIAHVTNLKANKIVFNTADTHLYKDHLEQAQLQIKRTPFPFPTFEINKKLKGKGFNALVDAKVDDFKILNYKSHASIKAKMSV